jgi:hypothetical protein
MKVLPALLSAVVVCLAQLMPAGAQEAPKGWEPGCDKALLDGEFSLAKAPEMPCSEEKKAFIDKVIDEVKSGDDRGISIAAPSKQKIENSEFTAFFLRAFADPDHEFGPYTWHIRGLVSRLDIADTREKMITDARLDWDMWRAWLLFENTAHMHDYYEVPREDGRKQRQHLHCARELLWTYLWMNSAAILKDPQRRTWWLTQLTADLEAPGGRPLRRWFLLLLLSKADAKRATLENIYLKPVFATRPPGEQKIYMRQPHPLDPFLLITGENPQAPPFSDALTQLALNNKLSLTVFGIDPAAQPATTVNTVSLEATWYPIDASKVINQESWSAPRDTTSRDRYLDYEWGRNLFPIHDRSFFQEINFPEDRRDGVFFFVYNQRLYVWPKAKMDTAIIQMLRTAKLIDAAAAAALEKRGFVPLKETLVKESPGK